MPKLSSNGPTHRLYSVCKLKDGRSSWTEIGVAWPHKDRQGFNFLLTATPAPGGTFVMRRDTPESVANGDAQ